MWRQTDDETAAAFEVSLPSRTAAVQIQGVLLETR
jgi:hypothetical protein